MLYIINTNDTNGRYHETHHYDCEYCPSLQHQEKLGEYNTDFIAMIIVRSKYKDAYGCRYCMPTEHPSTVLR